MAEGISFAGDVKVSRFEIVGRNGNLDLTPFILQIQIYEDIFAPFITGNVVLRESMDLVNKLPLAGEEFFNVHIHTPTFEGDNTKEIIGKFAVYKMTERSQITERSVGYTLHFVSMEGRVDIGKKIRSAFEGYPHEIAKKLIYDDELGLKTERTVNVEDTSNSIKFVCNSWSPMKAINYCASKSVNVDDSPTFTFFENRNGFNFISLTGLYKQNPIQHFVRDNYRRDPEDSGTRNIEQEYRRVSSIEQPVSFDFFERIKSGMFQAELTTYDFLTREFKKSRYNSLEEFSELEHLNQYPMMSLNLFRDPGPDGDRLIADDVMVFHRNEHDSLHNNLSDVQMNDYYLKRRSLLAQAEAFKVTIEVPGRTDYTVGKVVELTTYRNEQIDERSESPVDKMMSGKYLIGAINHVVTSGDHRCYIELIKESLMENFVGMDQS